MSSPANDAFDLFTWQDVNQLLTLDLNQLNSIKYHLDLLLLALEAIADLDSVAFIEAAKDLNLKLSKSDLGESFAQNKEIAIEQIKSLILIICYLARQHQELLRRAVGLLEQVTVEYKSSNQVTLLANYFDLFINYYQTRINQKLDISIDYLTQLAGKLLSNLLFYSGNNGHHLLLVVIIDAAKLSTNQ
ncbi:hypothetical protein NIES4102_39110 [Chondrocystis sp. NIES-4102]|nr:hypothetical protein NIES4102_39110 [Chondrocystis sp. NIES-4102]